MIEYAKGNLLEADTEALVNTVNCIGVMGKGIALQFKQAYPTNFVEYQKACRAKQVQPGDMFTVATNTLTNPRYIINFPTKRHWKGKSRIEDIKSGLIALVAEVQALGIKSIAVPPLGCGNGGLDWDEVKPLILNSFETLPEVRVLLYEPQSAPDPDKMKIGTNKPRMTKARALFISLMELYAVPGYRLSLLEIQKLAYFLQVTGEPLKLNFIAHFYGPYADNLNHVLQRLEGHFIRGYGDRSKDAQVYLIADAAQKAKDFLKDDEEALSRLAKVTEIIEGFETPYGMELLATVHWVCQASPGIEDSAKEVVKAVHSWNERKQRVFEPDHIVVALTHLRETIL